MGLSETILAAMIGAVATVATALFQIFTAFRARGKVESSSRPRKRSATRSMLAVLALMVASAAGGFLYSEFIKQRNSEDMRAMRRELRALAALIAENKDSARGATAADRAAAPAATTAVNVDAPLQGSVQAGAAGRVEGDTKVAAAAPVETTLRSAQDDGAGSVESVVYVPACRGRDGAAACNESDAQRVALCGTIPARARVDSIDLFAQADAVSHPWEQHRALFEQDLGGARFTGSSFEYAQGDEKGGARKAVCVNFVHWSSEHPHIARIVMRYSSATAAVAPAATAGASALGAPAVIAADRLPAIPQATSLPAPAGPK